MYKIIPSLDQTAYELFRQLDPGEEQYYQPSEYETHSDGFYWLPIANDISAPKLDRLAKAYVEIRKQKLFAPQANF